MKNLKVIGVDFDDVLMPTSDVMALWHNRVYGTSYEKEDIVSWEHLAQLWQCSQQEKHRRIHEFFLSEDHATMVPVQGAEEALRELEEIGIHVVMVTGRPEQFREETRSLIEKYFPSLITDMYFTSNLTEGIITDRPKSEKCLELGVEIFIDDHLQYAHNIALGGIPVLLFNTPWNQTETLPHNVQRVFSWEEIIEKFR